MLLVVVCGDDGASGRDVVLDGAALRGVRVVRRGEHHGRLVCLCVLMVQVYHTSTAVWCNRHTVEEDEKQEGCDEK